MWTELGIKVKTEGDRISATFRGVRVEAEKTEAGAVSLVEQIAAIEGVSGTTAALGNTLGVQISNLEDNFTNLRNEIGRLTENEAGDFIGFLNNATKKISEFLRIQNNSFGGLLDGVDGADELSKKYTELSSKALELRKEIERQPDIIRTDGTNKVAELEAQLREVLGALGEINSRQASIIIDDLNLQKAKDAAKALKEQEEAIKRQKEAQKELAKIEADRLDRLAEFNAADIALENIGFSTGALEDEIFDFGLGGLGSEIDSNVANALGQLDPETITLINESLSSLGDTIDNKVTANLLAAADASKTFSDAQKVSIATAVAASIAGANSIQDAIRGIINAFISQGIAALVSNTLKSASVTGPFALPIAAAAGAGAAALFKSIIPGFANGTSFAPEGWAMVGERGPELVRLPGGSDVFSNGQTTGMLQRGMRESGGGLSGTLTFEADKLVVGIEQYQKKRGKLY